jgi:hypothetical protein
LATLSSGSHDCLICAPEPFSIEAVVAAPNGGFSRACHQSADHALRSVAA